MGHVIMRFAAIAAIATMVLGFVAVQTTYAVGEVADNTISGNLDTFKRNVPILSTEDLPITAGKIVNAIISILGIVAVVIVLIGGFKWMTAGGNEEKVGEARQMLLAGVIGLIIILSAYAIANFVISRLAPVAGVIPGPG